jgi:hypothetical protein
MSSLEFLIVVDNYTKIVFFSQVTAHLFKILLDIFGYFLIEKSPKAVTVTPAVIKPGP